MKSKLRTVLGIAIALACSPATASPITYNVDLFIHGSGTNNNHVAGSITTNGAIGTLAP